MSLLSGLLPAGHALAVLLALTGAVLLALGTHAQHAAVTRSELARSKVAKPEAAKPEAARPEEGRSGAAGSGHPAGMRRLLRTPLWLLGGALIVLETVFNVIALGLAPIALIQPLGTASLALAVLLGARASHSPLTREAVFAVLLTAGSVAAFVSISAQHVEHSPASPDAAGVLAALLIAGSFAGVLLARSRAGHLARVAAAGILFGCVASGAHVAAARFLAGEGLPLPVWIVIAALAPASAVGVWLVQTAYASGSAATVLAGLTVIDPIAAVTVGTVVLGEYGTLPASSLALLAVSAAGALWGVRLLVGHRHGTLQAPRSPAVSASADTMGDAHREGVPLHP